MGICSYCPFKENSSEDFINENFNNSIYKKNIDFSNLDMSLRKRIETTGVRSYHLKEANFQEILENLVQEYMV